MFPSINWNLLSLELLISSVIVAIVLLEVFLPKAQRSVTISGFSVASLCALLLFWSTKQGLQGSTFGGMFIMDNLAWFYKTFFLCAMLAIIIMSRHYFDKTSPERNEHYFLLWLSLLGMCFTASSADLLLLFISIEILTISLYVMTAYLKSDKLSIEAGMKYLILGALASGFFLFGMSYIYGVAHSTNFSAIADYTHEHPLTPLMLLGMVFLVAAVAFKIASVPFHMWVPDVYQGAPTPVTALLSVGSKAAGFVVMLRLFYGVFAQWHGQWAVVLALLSALTMCYGNLVAMFQTNIKRLLGYSSIAHAGYLLMGIAAGSILGASAVNLYLVGYLATNLAAFIVIMAAASAAGRDEINEFAGLNKRSSFLAAAMGLALVSLAGLPPLAGFFGKFVLLTATVNAGFLWLALIAAVNIVISVYYYLNIVRKIYAEVPRDDSPIEMPAALKLILAVCLVGIIVVGTLPGPFVNAAITAAKVFSS